MPLYFFYTMVQKSQKWPKTQIKGGPALSSLVFPGKNDKLTCVGKSAWTFWSLQIRQFSLFLAVSDFLTCLGTAVWCTAKHAIFRHDWPGFFFSGHLITAQSLGIAWNCDGEIAGCGLTVGHGPELSTICGKAWFNWGHLFLCPLLQMQSTKDVRAYLCLNWWSLFQPRYIFTLVAVVS